MSFASLLLSGLWHHRRVHAAVALGVMVTSAVLTGALLVGDSVRGSLWDLALDRLGHVDEVLLTQQFFRQSLAHELAQRLTADPAWAGQQVAIAPAVLLRGTVEGTEGPRHRAGQVLVVGCDQSFWELGEASPAALPAGGEVVLNEPLARDLNVDTGAEVLIRVPKLAAAPAETPLGDATDPIRSVRLRVIDVVPARSLGRFGLSPTQRLPRNAFVATATLQKLLARPGRVNALLVGDGRPGDAPPAAASAALADALQPTLDDYGLRLQEVRLGDPQEPMLRYWNLTGEQLLLPAHVVERAEQALAELDVQPVLTYLANTVAAKGRKIPYSTICGVDTREDLGPYSIAGDPRLEDDEIVLTSWVVSQQAEDQNLDVQAGDLVTLTYYEPESTHGELRTATPGQFRVRGIAPLAAPGQAPQRTNDPQLAPELEGVTDSATIRNWDLPFELVEEIRDADEQYWEDHRATPKAYVSLATARRLWSSRFGDTTSLRIPHRPGRTPSEILDRLQLQPSELGFRFLPVKRQALQAAAGTTPFDGLFLGFSSFLIVAAVLLSVLLFRLGVEQRATQLGVLRATGWPAARLNRLLGGEGLVVAGLGSALGVGLGVGYAALLLAGLRSGSWWLTAISTPFLELHWTWPSLLIGYLATVVISLWAIWWSLRRLRDVPARELLAGSLGDRDRLLGSTAARRWRMWLAIGVALLLGLAAVRLRAAAQAGAFFASGAAVLAAALFAVRDRLARPVVQRQVLHLSRLASLNVARNPTRSLLTMGLVAAACFLIVAISAFRQAPTEEGTGGFALVCEADQTFVEDLDSAAVRDTLPFSPAETAALAKARLFALRVRGGDDASCLNLYRPRQPRLLGVSPLLIERGGFTFAASRAATEAEQANPWLLLQRPLESGAVPVVLDANTAQYSLNLKLGEQLTLTDDRGGTLTLELVGTLRNSLFQGDLLISDAAFLQHFPQTQGFRLWLVDLETTAAATDDTLVTVQQALETGLRDWGFDATPASGRLAEFLAVQNTYLSTFQSLGGLGLLLGTFGLAVVQLRSVLERRGELAMLRVCGFRRRRLAQLVTRENAYLLLVGMGVGLLAAGVAVLPHLLLGGATIPWLFLLLTLAAIVAAGWLAGGLAVRAVVRGGLIAALRDE